MNKQDDKKNFWNRFAGMYDFVIKKDKKGYSIMIEDIKKLLNPDMAVLELATGPGIISIAIADKCKSVIATDFSHKMIETASKKPHPQNVTFEVQDATNLIYSEKAFDAIIIANALHIMPDPKKALENINRVLKDDGILIAPTFIYNGKFKELLFTKPMELAGFKTFSRWSFDEYISFLEDNGWNVNTQKCIPARLPIAYTVAKKAI